MVKYRIQHSQSARQSQSVVYLPGLELRTQRTDDKLTEDFQVITAGQIRVLHWQQGKPEDIANDPLRYSLGNQIGSSLLELDNHGDIISQEEYYPFGGTAVWCENKIEAKYKTVRYSGKERDATGLYYYGQRYYQPWLGRWLSADPAGTVDGLNLYRMVRNNPIILFDGEGLAPTDEKGIEPSYKGKYERVLSMTDKMKMKVFTLKSLTHQDPLGPEKNVSKDVQAVKVDDPNSGYNFTTQELMESLKRYKETYKSLNYDYAKVNKIAKGEYPKSFKENIKLGYYFSKELIRKLEKKEFNTESYASKKIREDIFVLLKKETKVSQPGNRIALSIAYMSREKSETHKGDDVHIKTVISFPVTQVDINLNVLKKLGLEKIDFPIGARIKGAATTLVLKSLLKLNQETSVDKIHTTAVNERSGYLAKSFKMQKVTQY